MLYHQTSPLAGTKHKSESERKQQILQCATECFIDNGYRGTTMKKIMEATNLSKGAIYHYFNSKEDIFFSIIEESKITIELDLDMMEAEGHQLSSLEVFFKNKQDYICRLYKFAMVCHEMLGHQIAQDHLNYTMNLTKKSIKKAIINNGYDNPSLPIDDLVSVTYLMFEGLLSMKVSMPDFDTDKELANIIHATNLLAKNK